MLYSQYFCDMSELWNTPNSVPDSILMQELDKLELEKPAAVREPHVPIVEDITIEDDVVFNAVNKIESE